MHPLCATSSISTPAMKRPPTLPSLRVSRKAPAADQEVGTDGSCLNRVMEREVAWPVNGAGRKINLTTGGVGGDSLNAARLIQVSLFDTPLNL